MPLTAIWCVIVAFARIILGCCVLGGGEKYWLVYFWCCICFCVRRTTKVLDAACGFVGMAKRATYMAERRGEIFEKSMLTVSWCLWWNFLEHIIVSRGIRFAVFIHPEFLSRIIFVLSYILEAVASLAKYFRYSTLGLLLVFTLALQRKCHCFKASRLA